MYNLTFSTGSDMCASPVIGTVIYDGETIGEYEVNDQCEYEALIRSVDFANLEQIGC